MAMGASLLAVSSTKASSLAGRRFFLELEEPDLVILSLEGECKESEDMLTMRATLFSRAMYRSVGEMYSEGQITQCKELAMLSIE